MVNEPDSCKKKIISANSITEAGVYPLQKAGQTEGP